MDTVAPTKQIMTMATRAARTGIDGIIFLAKKADFTEFLIGKQVFFPKI
jgi:hypothetical protein